MADNTEMNTNFLNNKSPKLIEQGNKTKGSKMNDLDTNISENNNVSGE